MDAFLAASLVWVFMLGIAAGNYATTFVHRLPRGGSATTKHPFCSGCGTMLQPKDLFPLFSWLMLKGKCRYCAMPIPSVYFWVELWTAVIFMAGFTAYGWDEPYILICVGGTVAVTLWAIEFQDKMVAGRVISALLVLGLLFRTLLDHSLMDGLYGMVLGVAVPLIYWRAKAGEAAPTGEHEPIRIPKATWLSAAAGAWLGVFGWCVFMLLWGALRLIGRVFGDVSLTSGYVPALMGLLLFPAVLESAGHYAVALLRALAQ